GVSQCDQIASVISSIGAHGKSTLPIVGRWHVQIRHHSTSENRVPRALLVIHARHTEVLILVGKQTEGSLAAGIGGCGEPGGDLQRRRIESRRRDLVVHETEARWKINLPPVVTGRGGDGREVTLEHGGG